MKLLKLATALTFVCMSFTGFNVPSAHAAYTGSMISGTGLCLDVARSDIGKKGGRVIGWKCHGKSNQQWTIQGKRGEILSSTGMCLDASRSNMHKNGAKVMIWDCHGGPNQNWVFAGSGLRNGSGLCLDISKKSLSSSGGKSGKIQLWDCHFEANQQWNFQEIGSVSHSEPAEVTPAPVKKKKGALPHMSSVAAGQPSAMDGLWKLELGGLPFQIDSGRMYSMSDYMHLLIFPVETYDVVVKDLVQTGPGQLAGQDLVLLGPWTGQLQADGTIKLNVQGALGPFNSKLIPMQLADEQWFAQEVAMVTGGVRPPPVRPGPPVDMPVTSPQPDDDQVEYPAGWGQ